MQPLGFLFLFLISLWGCSATAPGHSDTSGSYHGEVYDAETGKPIEGAVVVVFWYKKPALAMNGPQYLHKAVEVLTDAEGRFSVDASRGIDWNPGTYVLKKPRFVIFKPGYSAFPRGYGEELEDVLDDLYAKQGVVVGLQRLKSQRELRRYTSHVDLGVLSDVAPERIPTLIRLINIQRKSLRLPPYAEPLEGGQKP